MDEPAMTSHAVADHCHGGAAVANCGEVTVRQSEEEKENQSRLFSSIHTMKSPLLEEFLQTSYVHGPTLSAAGKPLIHYAIRNCPAAILPLVRAGCDVTAPDTVHLDTPLHVACFYGLLDVAVFLVQRGACVNSLNNSGQTPLDKLLCLCQHPSKNSSTRSRLLMAHLLTRMGFKVNPKAQGQRPGTRGRILHSYNKAKICSDGPTLLHISRLRVRELLPPGNLEPVVTLLPVPVDLQDFLLFRPVGLDHHVTCSHVQDLILSYRQPPCSINVK